MHDSVYHMCTEVILLFTIVFDLCIVKEKVVVKLSNSYKVRYSNKTKNVLILYFCANV